MNSKMPVSKIRDVVEEVLKETIGIISSIKLTKLKKEGSTIYVEGSFKVIFEPPRKFKMTLNATTLELIDYEIIS